MQFKNEEATNKKRKNLMIKMKNALINYLRNENKYLLYKIFTYWIGNSINIIFGVGRKKWALSHIAEDYKIQYFWRATGIHKCAKMSTNNNKKLLSLLYFQNSLLNKNIEQLTEQI